MEQTNLQLTENLVQEVRDRFPKKKNTQASENMKSLSLFLTGLGVVFLISATFSIANGKLSFLYRFLGFLINLLAWSPGEYYYAPIDLNQSAHWGIPVGLFLTGMGIYGLIVVHDRISPYYHTVEGILYALEQNYHTSDIMLSCDFTDDVLIYRINQTPFSYPVKALEKLPHYKTENGIYFELNDKQHIKMHFPFLIIQENMLSETKFKALNALF